MTDYRAHCTGRLNGRKVSRYPVLVRLNNSRACRTDREVVHVVLAYTAPDAAAYVRELYATRAETEIIAFGPYGGQTHRYIGWETAIGAAMAARPRQQQLTLF
jgi:hypothetical protein